MIMLLKRNAIVTMSLVCFSFTLYAQVNPKEKLAQAMKSIQDNYVDSLTDESLTDAAIAGMIRSLDPHSRYYSRTEAMQMQASMKGSFAGIGIQFMMQQDSLYVTQVISGGPAEKSGLLVGDRILSVNGQPVAGETNFSIMNKIRGEKGSPVALVLQRRSATLSKELVRASIADHSVRAAYMTGEKVGYISLRIFNQTTRTEIDKAIGDLKAKGMQSLVLDLQGNGGGYVEAAIGVADEFLKPDQLVFYSVGQDKGKDYYYTGGFGKFQEGKLVVLIDQNTASASEILTGALQDWDRAVIVGRRSFGKGLMQRPVPLFDGSVLELTGARYFTPSGRSIQKPYHGDTYSDNVQTRFASGELFDAAVVHFPDSLKYTTLVNKRAVYGGGGIMPDRYIPVDTVEDNGWLQDISALNLTGSVSISYMDLNREKLLAAYKDFDAFNKQFSVPAALTQQIVTSAEKAGFPLHSGSKDRIISLLALEVKGQVANQLFGGNDYYIQVMNSDNRSLQEALHLLANPAAFAGQLKNIKK
jgi:carboxyl-terminal processing protease